MLQIHEVELSNLRPWEGNPRLNDHAVDAVLRSITAFGFNVPILCDQNLMIVAGHTRWKAAKKLGLQTVPVIILEMTDARRRAFSLADNKTAEIADWDPAKLRDALRELITEEVDPRELGFSHDELRRYLLQADEEDRLPEVEGAPQTKPGDLVTLGPHRLLCGDSRDGEMVRRPTGLQPVDHVFGGPPYFNQREYAHWGTYEAYLLDMRKIIENCRDMLKDGGVLVWNIANECSSHRDLTSRHSMLLDESGLRYLDTIVWAKRGANYAVNRNCHIPRNHCYYPALQWEALLVFQRPGPMPKMTRDGVEYMSKHHTDVWEIPAVTNQVATYGHPAVCPVEIPYRCLQAYTGVDACVFEPFGGSGTTLVAAEKASRRALVIERSPAYCDLIVKRWEDLTGRKAARAPSL